MQCSFWITAAAERADPEPPTFRGLQVTPLGFTLDYVRPSFFAAETMPIVVQVAEDLGLLIFDAQRQDSKGRKPRRYSAVELAQSWEASNAPEARAVRGHTQRYISYCPRDRLDYYWQYMRHRQALEQTYAGRDIAVPEIALLWPKKGGSTILACTWANLTTVLPEVDYLLVQREIRRLGGLMRRDEEGLVSLADARQWLGESLQPREEPVPHLLFEDEDPPPDVAEAFLTMPLLELEEGCEQTQPDRVVDVPPG
ncbi:MAG: hypothetical protein ACE5JM_13365 [Armatimonadota bacterium]